MNTKTRKPTQTVPLLTEEEILKMSDDDYMNPAQLAFFKNRLQQMERDLIRNAGQTTENLRDDSGSRSGRPRHDRGRTCA